MSDRIITRECSEYQELYRNLCQAIRNLDILIGIHRPSVYGEAYLTSEEICCIFSISKRSLQNYRDNRQIPYTTIGGQILYPQSAILEVLERHFRKALR